MLLTDLECWSCLRCMQPAGFIASAVLFAIFWYVLQIRHLRVRLLPHLLHRAHLRPHPHQVSLGLAVLAEVDLWLLPAASGCIRGHASYWPGMLIMLEMHATCWLYHICCSLCYILIRVADPPPPSPPPPSPPPPSPPPPSPPPSESQPYCTC